MPSYAPLPHVLLDPRNEAELVRQAAQRVYEASNATLNDFSSGSPIMALLEGQAFAQAEFLQFANEFPESVLTEWIGPFLGAQRRTGAGSVVELTFEISPRSDQFSINPGYLTSTRPALTGGESVSFVTTERLTIPPGDTIGKVRAVSVFKGAATNVPEKTIVRADTKLDGVVSVINEEPAQGGQDAELLSEVKERFFSLIRRRNPVSAEDWEDWFTDALGPGTSVTVLSRRSERDTYVYGGPYQVKNQPYGAPFAFEYGGNYLTSNPSVAFFVLNPDGTPITKAQQGSLQNLLKWSLPTEFLGYVYPMEVNDIDFQLSVSYDPTKPYAQDQTRFNTTVRNNLLGIMSPNAVFPIEYAQTVNDVEGALTTSFPITLGTTNQYVDPDILSLKAYGPPVGIGIQRFKYVQPNSFTAGWAVEKDDLIVIDNSAGQIFYPALESFNPEIDTKYYHVNTGDLDVELIRRLEVGTFKLGDVVFHEDNIYVVLIDFTYNPNVADWKRLVELEYVSAAKDFTEWVGGRVVAFGGTGKQYDPQIFAYEEGDLAVDPAWPRSPESVDKTMRPGAPVFVPNRDFAIADNSTKLGTAQVQDLVGRDPVRVLRLEFNMDYKEGQYVKTPSSNELLPDFPSDYNCYLDPVKGVTEIYCKVARGFTFRTVDRVRVSYAQMFELAVEQGFLEVVDTIVFEDCKGDPTFAGAPFRYEARFRAGEYVRYRPEGGFDAGKLELCLQDQARCAELSQPCRKLIDGLLPQPRYFYTLKDFTPHTQDVNQLIDEELIEEVERVVFIENFYAYLPFDVQVTTKEVNDFLIKTGQIPNTEFLVEGDTCLIKDFFEDEVRGLYIWTMAGDWQYFQKSIAPYRDLFRFAPGDIAMFRYVSELRAYKATTHVTPLLDLEIYYDNGVFVETCADETVKYYDPEYHLEDVIYDSKSGQTDFYRVLRSFNPPKTRNIWSGSEAEDSPRLEELYGNMLKFSVLHTCGDSIQARLRDGAGSVKLGRLEMFSQSKPLGSQETVFVFESSSNPQVAAPISNYPGLSAEVRRTDYGDGTLGL